MLIRLKPNQMDYFLGLDPFEILEGARNEKISCIGAVAQEAKKGSVPVGLMIYDTSGKDLTVLWLFVAPPYRRKGIGEQLLQAAFLQAKKKQQDEVRVIMKSSNPFGWDSICDGASEYLKRHLFTQDKESAEHGGLIYRCKVETFFLDRQEAEDYDPSFDAFFGEIRNDAIAMSKNSGLEAEEPLESQSGIPSPRALTKQDLVVTVGELSKNKLLSQPVRKQSGVCPIGDLTLRQLQDGITACLSVRARESFDEDLKAMPVTWYETEVSSCVLKDGRVTGLLLVHEEMDQTLWVEYFCINGKDLQSELLNMIRVAVKNAAEMYPPETKAVIRRHDEKIKSLTEKLFS